MLLPRHSYEVEPLFGFYRIGWLYAEEQLPIPDIDTTLLPASDAERNRVMYSQYDLQAGYIAYIHHTTKQGATV